MDKINKAIINDDVKKLDEIISNNPDALDHVDDKGKTLLHQCVLTFRHRDPLDV